MMGLKKQIQKEIKPLEEKMITMCGLLENILKVLKSIDKRLQKS